MKSLNNLNKLAQLLFEQATRDKDLENLKNGVAFGMVQNFKKDGYLTPVLFFVNNHMQPHFEVIPQEVLATPQGKQILGNVIKKICSNLQVIAAGMIIEAYAKTIHQDKDNELDKLIQQGDVRVSELKEKQDIIMMIFSTPNKEETIAYYVDPKTKTIKDKLPEGGEAGGLFSKFFEWRKAGMN